MELGKNYHLQELKKDIKLSILEQYPTIENFCFINDLPKATISRLLSEADPNFTMQTLMKVAHALGKTVEMRLK